MKNYLLAINSKLVFLMLSKNFLLELRRLGTNKLRTSTKSKLVLKRRIYVVIINILYELHETFNYFLWINIKKLT